MRVDANMNGTTVFVATFDWNYSKYLSSFTRYDTGNIVPICHNLRGIDYSRNEQDVGL